MTDAEIAEALASLATCYRFLMPRWERRFVNRLAAQLLDELEIRRAA